MSQHKSNKTDSNSDSEAKARTSKEIIADTAEILAKKIYDAFSEVHSGKGTALPNPDTKKGRAAIEIIALNVATKCASAIKISETKSHHSARTKVVKTRAEKFFDCIGDALEHEGIITKSQRVDFLGTTPLIKRLFENYSMVMDDRFDKASIRVLPSQQAKTSSELASLSPTDESTEAQAVSGAETESIVQEPDAAQEVAAIMEGIEVSAEIAEDVSKICVVCGIPTKKKCHCKTVRYCSKECQTKDWPSHRLMCTAERQ